MGAIKDKYDEVYRDHATDGVQSSGPHNPEKREQRAIGPLIELAVANAALGAMVDVAYATRAELEADLAHEAASVGLVFADPIDANNDLYSKSGASGSGSWTLTTTLNDTIEAKAKPLIDAGLAETAVVRYEEGLRPNLIDGGPDSLSRWVKSAPAASLTYIDDNGEGVFRFAHSSPASLRWNIQRDKGESKLSYYFVLKEKTGGTGSNSGRFVIYEKEEPEGISSTEGNNLQTTARAFPSGDVNEDMVFKGTIDLHGDGSRIVYTIETEGASSLKFALPSAAYGAGAGMRTPPQLTQRGLNAISYPLVKGYKRHELGGAFDAETDVIAPEVKWFVNDSGDLETKVSVNFMRYWDGWLKRPDLGNWEIEARATVTGGTASRQPGVVFGIGSGAARRFYCYLRDGTIGVFGNDSVRNLADGPAGNTYPDMAFDNDEVATIALIARQNGTGILTATHPSGETFSMLVSGIPVGSVCPAWRSYAVGKIHSLTCQPIPSHVMRTLDNLGVAAGATTTADLLDFTVLPDRIIDDHSTWAELSGIVGNQGDYARVSNADGGTHTDPVTSATVSNAGVFQYIAGSPSGWRRVKSKWTRGYTGTGVCEITKGAFAGCFATADDGRLEEGDNSTFSPRIAIWPRDFRGSGSRGTEPLMEIRGDWDHSAQGITFNSITQQLVLACSGDKTIRSFDIYGGAAGTEDVAARIDASAAPLSMAGNINALVFVPSQGSSGGLLIGETTSSTIKKYDIGAGAVVNTYTLGNTPDHFWLDSDENTLLYTWSANGTDAVISKFVLSTATGTVFATLPRCQAPEGFHVDKATGVALIINDSGFHHSATQPALNMVMRYRVPPLL